MSPSEAAAAHLRARSHAGPGERLELDYWIADADDATHENVGIDACPMSQLLDDPGPGHLLQVPTRLAELDTEALDLADPEAFADEAVHVHVAHSHLPASLSRHQSNVLDDLGGNERQRLAWRGSVGMEMTIAFESLTGNCSY